jgi:hypothetical protein
MQLSEETYARLKQACEVLQQPLETVLIHTIQAGLPPSVDDLPSEQQEAFTVMARLSDRKLWAIARSVLPPARQRRLTQLLSKNQSGVLSARERRALEALHREVNLLTLRKAHAYALLKWRGRSVPVLAELQHDS